MSDSESEDSIHSRRSDDESECLSQYRASSEPVKQPCATTHDPSVEQSKTSVTRITGGNIALAASPSSAHN